MILMNIIVERYRPYVRHREFWFSLVLSTLLLIGSLFVNYFAGTYATLHESNSVTDLILSNIRVYDVDFVFVWGAIAFWVLLISLFLFEPKKIPFTLKSVALFVLIRALFVSLTHIASFPTQVHIDLTGIISYFTFGGDLFFSGHTGLPFLAALVFWKNLRLRIIFLALSVLFAFVVLMGHLHYSIDVLSAYFITYGIWVLAEKFFKKDLLLFNREM
ncbi:MAG: hypothetical protein JWO73_25 [Candidatus Taylorbacteria bacterium]|nr:hypothetical protein [Candidatus Taylorbacteria bacterium]